MDSLKDIEIQLERFKHDRDWDQFHTPKNLILALTGEIGELASLVQWSNNADIYMPELKSKVSKEMADIFIYLVNLSNTLDVDLIGEVQLKIADNARRYQVDLFKGSNKKADK